MLRGGQKNFPRASRAVFILYSDLPPPLNKFLKTPLDMSDVCYEDVGLLFSCVGFTIVCDTTCPTKIRPEILSVQ